MTLNHSLPDAPHSASASLGDQPPAAAPAAVIVGTDGTDSTPPAGILPLPPDAAPPTAAVPLGERLTWTTADLSALTGISTRHLRRLDADRHIPGRLTSGRRVLYVSETIREWIRAGMPDYEQWAALQRRPGKR